ncbi:acetyl-CoA carboxylase carboxyltransferase subunit alpha [Ruminococcus sp. 5_1_39BFAA]|uniref:acetyl-CoA carboxylase carboxyltransferase subunit alpha n=1 Tax=Ruminococcus sp. 5_1_39BFAA TaxID=457412 RepID=UPI003561B36B
MKLNHTFKRTVTEPVFDVKDENIEKPEVPEGLLKKCNACKSAVFVEEVRQNYYICPHCRNYFRVHAYRRIEMITDEGSFEEWDKGLHSGNPLRYKGYREKVEGLREKYGLDEAIITGKALIGGNPAVLGVCDSRFMMASMGEVVGEKIARAVERATREKLPVIIFACSGGARMQEGIVSLMQMAKTAAALKRHSDAGLLYISVLTNPTTGGVTASFAMLGDVILAEPGALIGFAGPRVIEQTIGQKLPKGFQKSEFLLEHGFIDRIVERENLREELKLLLEMHSEQSREERGSLLADQTMELLKDESILHDCSTIPDIIRGILAHPSLVGNEGVKKQITEIVFEEKSPLKKVDAWEHVMLARDKERPTGKDYIELLFENFTEFHGDRYFGDDSAVIGGIACFYGLPVTVIVQEKGQGTKENIARNFGMVSPEGYRKALRLMKQAEKFGHPVICLVDTPGAFCGLEAEERGQGEAIARNLYELSGLAVPVLSIVIGEGGSGGALALAVADEVWMMENSVYSILSPEGFASILWKDSKRAKEAAGVMKLTARDLEKLGIVEHVIREKERLTRDNLGKTTDRMSLGIAAFLAGYGALSPEKLVEKRYQRFRKL